MNNLDELKELFPGSVREQVSFAEMTFIELGGEASVVVETHDADQLVRAIQWCITHGHRYVLLGSGSNVIASDEGFKGVVIRSHGGKAVWNGEEVTVDAGMLTDELVSLSVSRGLAGMENLAGVPGTVGGAVRGNAGAYGTEIKRIIISVTTLTQGGKLTVLPVEQCGFGYRTSAMKERGLHVIKTTMKFTPGDVTTLTKKTDEIRETRKKKYSVIGKRTAGSVFKNLFFAELPERWQLDQRVKDMAKGGKVPAWFFIEEADCGGKQVGQVKMSEEHANTIVHLGGGRAEDALILLSYIKQQVRDRCGVQLQEEVQYLGF